jgi:MoaA/NifB/PqqE/SkfB family radical SAM enzyme
MNNTYASKQVKQIEFDITSSCNATCPSCSRYVVKNDGETYLNEFINYNKHISVEIISDIFSSSYIDDYVKVDLVGSIGDPMANPKILQIVQTMIKLKPESEIVLHTNGGLKTKELFFELSKSLKDNGSIWFSIDGLEDTNHMYRKGVNWKKVYENLKAAVAGGCDIKWQFIEFPWNSHQVEEARKLAEDIGVKRFVVRKNRLDQSLQQYYFDAFEKGFHGNTKVRDDNEPWTVKRHAYTSIDPECFNDQRMYINSDAEIVPCCSISTSIYDQNYRKEYYEFIAEFGENWNNLNYNSFNSIAESGYWDKLHASVQDDATCTMTKCLEKCAKYKG